MAGLLSVGEMGALALHSMLEVAKRQEHGEKGWISTSDIADDLKASRHTLHKVVKRLVQADLLESSRGPLGGVRLKSDPGQTSLLRIVEAVDGEINTGGCLFSRRVCEESDICQFCGITVDLEKLVREYFAGTSLFDLLERLKKTPVYFNMPSSYDLNRNE